MKYTTLISIHFLDLGEHSLNIGCLYTGEDAMIAGVCVVTCTPVDIDHSSTKVHSVALMNVLTKDGVYKDLKFQHSHKITVRYNLIFHFACYTFHL